MFTLDQSWLAILKKHLPALCWAGLIYYLSNQSRLPSAQWGWLDFVIKHFAHIFVYAILYFLLWSAQKPRKILPFLLTLGYALSDEYHQSFVAGRQMSFMDIGFDTFGIFSAWWIITLLSQKTKQKRHKKTEKP